jgi:DegV family protein with EDD domain
MIKIFADTTACFSLEKAKALGLVYLPQIIVFGEKTYRDDTELDTAQFISLLKSSASLPKTAAPPPALYEPYLKEYATEGNTVIIICPSGAQSGTVRSATVAAQDFPDADIRVFDSRSIGSGLANMVLKALEWVNEGLDADTVMARLESMSQREDNYFVVDTLEYLHKGGRIGSAQALVGGLLQVKPILTNRGGTAAPVESQRTHKRAMARIKEIVFEKCPPTPDSMLGVMHGDAEEIANSLAEELKTHFGFDKVPVYNLPPAFLVHAGPGVIGISFFNKE